MKYSTSKLACNSPAAILILLTGVLLGLGLDCPSATAQLPELHQLESVWIVQLDHTPDDLWVDDRYGQHLVKEQHRWRSAAEVFAEACWYEGALAVADYYFSPGPRNMRDLPLFLNLIQQVARQAPVEPVYLPMHNCLFTDPLGRYPIGEDDHMRLRHQSIYRPELRLINSPHPKP